MALRLVLNTNNTVTISMHTFIEVKMNHTHLILNQTAYARTGSGTLRQQAYLAFAKSRVRTPPTLSFVLKNSKHAFLNHTVLCSETANMHSLKLVGITERFQTAARNRSRNIKQKYAER